MLIRCSYKLIVQETWCSSSVDVSAGWCVYPNTRTLVRVHEKQRKKASTLVRHETEHRLEKNRPIGSHLGTYMVYLFCRRARQEEDQSEEMCMNLDEENMNEGMH